MKLEVDYIQQYEESQIALDNIKTTPPSQEGLDKLHLTMDLVSLKESQYERTKNEKKWNAWVNIFYPMLCKTASIQGGHVTLEINEDSFYGSLKYLGHDLMLNNVFDEDLSVFALMLTMTDDFYISRKDGLLELHFSFYVHDKVKVTDHSEEIHKLESQIYSPQYLEIMRKNSVDGDE